MILKAKAIYKVFNFVSCRVSANQVVGSLCLHCFRSKFVPKRGVEKSAEVDLAPRVNANPRATPATIESIVCRIISITPFDKSYPSVDFFWEVA